MIVSHKLVRTNTGNLSADGVERTLRVRCVSNSDDDDSGTAITYLLGQGYELGSPYRWGSTTEPNIQLIRLRPSLSRERRVFYVDLEYAGAGSEDFQNTPVSGSIPFPQVLQAFVEVDYRSISKPVPHSLFRGFVNADGDPITINNNRFTPQTRLPVSCTNEVPLMPPRERLEYFPAFLVTSYRTGKWRKTSKGQGMINSAITRILTFMGKRIQFDAAFGKQTLLCTSETWRSQLVNGTVWHTVQREILYNENGWFVDELDRGIVARARRDDPGIDSAAWVKMQANGDGPFRRILDPMGNPITDPVPLDGKGQPLINAEIKDSIFLQWQDLDEIDFNTAFGDPFIAADSTAET